MLPSIHLTNNPLINKASTICKPDHLEEELDHLWTAFICNSYERAIRRITNPWEKGELLLTLDLHYPKGCTDRMGRLLTTPQSRWHRLSRRPFTIVKVFKDLGYTTCIVHVVNCIWVKPVDMGERGEKSKESLQKQEHSKTGGCRTQCRYTWKSDDTKILFRK